jgi:hypothetical protein
MEAALNLGKEITKTVPLPASCTVTPEILFEFANHGIEIVRWIAPHLLSQLHLVIFAPHRVRVQPEIKRRKFVFQDRDSAPENRAKMQRAHRIYAHNQTLMLLKKQAAV